MAPEVERKVLRALDLAADYFDGLCDEIRETCRESLVETDWCLACRIIDANEAADRKGDAS